jgi:ferredoxin
MSEHNEVRLLVDRDRCEGYGMCEQAAPELVHINDDDEPVIANKPIPAERRPAADAAVRACPVAALSISTAKRP